MKLFMKTCLYHLVGGLFATLAMGTSMGYCQPSGQDALEIVPRRLTIPGRIPEPEVIYGSLTLQNRASSVLTIVEATGSCGCLEMIVKNASSKGFPLLIRPGESASLGVKVSSQNRIGKQETGISVGYRIGEGPVKYAQGYLDYQVQAGWRAFPFEVVAKDMLEGESREEFIGIYDGFADPGLEIGEIRNPRPDLVTVKITSDHVPGVASSLKLENNETLSLRYVVKLHLLAPKMQSQDSAHIVLISREAGRQQIALPVVLQRERNEITLKPDRISFAAPGSGSKRFSILCQTETTPIGEVKVDSTDSPFVQVIDKFELGPNEKLFEITINQPDLRPATRSRIYFISGKSKSFLDVEFIQSPALESKPSIQAK